MESLFPGRDPQGGTDAEFDALLEEAFRPQQSASPPRQPGYNAQVALRTLYIPAAPVPVPPLLKVRRMSPKILLALLTWLLLAANALAQDVIGGRCVAVSDGDTIRVLATGRELLRIRGAWIDAPEMGQPFGKRAKQFMSALVFGKDVELHPHAIDRYGRTVAMVFVDGRDVGLMLIKAGLAWAYEHYLPEATLQIQAQYSAAETAARVSRKGLWADGKSAVPPWEWRREKHEQRLQARLQL